MRLLLDTHVFLWWVKNEKKLGPKARQSIQESEDVMVSIISAWEFAVKKALGKLELGADFEEAIDAEGFSKLNITFNQARMIGKMQPHHGDPFDRMLVAQAIAEGLVFVTVDRRLSNYPVKIIDGGR